jgi:hypothetical protein
VVKKIEVYEAMKKLIVEVLVEVISGVIAKLISGGAAGRQPKIRATGQAPRSTVAVTAA